MTDSNSVFESGIPDKELAAAVYRELAFLRKELIAKNEEIDQLKQELRSKIAISELTS